MKLILKNKGFTVVEVIMVVVGVVIIIALGLSFYMAATKPSDTAQTSTTTVPTAVPDVNTTSDLDAASQDLDQLNFEDADDSAQLDAQQTAF